ncbi:hypothetical protein PO909_026480, partial [Leuciscus waleckii]
FYDQYIYIYDSFIIQINTIIFFYFPLLKNPEKKLSVSTEILSSMMFSTLIIRRNHFLSRTRMISEGSCDTEDWSNDF